LNKAELVKEMAAVLENKQQATAALNSILQTIETVLIADDTVTLPGFGTFKVHARKARNGINPKTGEKIAIAACRVPKFVPSKKLNDLL
jgi:DNA-binding protein HU-beta